MRCLAIARQVFEFGRGIVPPSPPSAPVLGGQLRRCFTLRARSDAQRQRFRCESTVNRSVPSSIEHVAAYFTGMDGGNLTPFWGTSDGFQRSFFRPRGLGSKRTHALSWGNVLKSAWSWGESKALDLLQTVLPS